MKEATGDRPRVLVVGAGIGGLTTALALHAAGIGAVVVESSRRLLPLGVGINLLPHAVRELTELRLADGLAATGIPTATLAYHDRFGSLIWSEPRGEGAGYRWPQYSIHRGHLQMVLLDAVRRRLGAESVRTGLALEWFDQSGDKVRAHLRNRATGEAEVVVADVMVGADGIRSAVRAQLHPHEGPPIWNGISMWRGVTEGEPFLGGRTMIMAGSNLRSKFVAYPISRETEGRGRALINWVAEVRTDGDRQPEPADWNRAGRVAEVLPHFAGWRFPWLDAPRLIRDCPAILEYPMVDRDPLDRWSVGRVTLLGDAAHPMYPIGSNGASQAIIDARVLAWHLATSDDPVAALAAYDAARRPPTSALVVANRDMGPERVLRLVAERAPAGFTRIDDVVGRDELAVVTGGYRQVAGFDVDDLNSRPSWDVCSHRPPTWRDLYGVNAKVIGSPGAGVVDAVVEGVATVVVAADDGGVAVGAAVVEGVVADVVDACPTAGTEFDVDVADPPPSAVMDDEATVVVGDAGSSSSRHWLYRIHEEGQGRQKDPPPRKARPPPEPRTG